MKRKLKNTLLLVLLGLLSVFAFAGCKLNESREDYLEQFNLTATVTYYTDVVEFDDGTRVTEVCYQTNSPALNIGVVPATGSISTQFSAMQKANYKFDGWYFVELDANGNPVFADEAKTQYKLTDEKVDFSKRLTEGTHWHIGAKWSPLVGLRVVMLCEENERVNGTFNETQVSYANGDVMFDVQFPSTAKLTQTEVQAANKLVLPENAYTFVNYYMDESCTTVFNEVQKTEDTTIVYAKYLTGVWNIVSNASGVADMFKNPAEGKRYWIAKDIDCSSYARTIVAPENFACEVQSSGKTIKGVTVKRVDTNTMATGHKAALFGNIQSTAKISNVNFEDVTVYCTIKSSPVEIYLAFTSLAAGARIENVKISGKLDIHMTNQTITNLLGDDNKNVAFGGYTTDAAYTAANPNGFVLDGTVTVAISR